MKTPSYVFYEKIFKDTVNAVKEMLGDNIPLCYSIKANPFLLNCVPDNLAKIEVCSPGELSICQKLNIPAERIIYSGVMKEAVDVKRAVDYDVAIMTAESPLHLKLENEACLERGLCKKVILRLSSGNQFGMSQEDIINLVEHKEDYPGVNIIGLHYYSGTQKKLRSIDKDLKRLEETLVILKERFGFEPELVEYGPGLTIDYFQPEMAENDRKALEEGAKRIRAFAEKYPMGIEMGRFLASACGVFFTQVKDLKTTKGVNYVICDGGIHHLKYYGQTMAMLIPPIATGASIEDLAKLNGDIAPLDSSEEVAEGNDEYCLCGSLCTVADVLVRNVRLKKLSVGDVIAFGKCGAYSVTEGSSLFLSRDLPAIYLARESGEMELLRDIQPSYILNIQEEAK